MRKSGFWFDPRFTLAPPFCWTQRDARRRRSFAHSCSIIMSSGTALRRLKKEYAIIDKEPPPGVLIVRPLERNFLHAHFLLGGEAFYDTPYEGGCFHGVLQFPKEYPMKPPAVIMRTPSGRFQPDKKVRQDPNSPFDFAPT